MTNTKTISKRVLTFILAIVTSMAFMPAMALTQPAYATSYIPLIIGGKTFAFPSGQQSAYATTTTKGTVSDPEMLDTEPDKWNIKWDGRTLTLKDAEITVTSGKAIYCDARCELHLIRENTVIDKDTASAASLWDGPLTITGEVGAYVRINAVGKGISGSNTLSISSGTVYSKSTEDNGIYTSGDITIGGGIVTGLSTATTGNYSGIKTDGEMSVSGGTVVARSAHSNSGCGAETAFAPVITGGAVYAEGGKTAFSTAPVGETRAALSGETISSTDKSVVIMTKKEDTTYTPTVTFADSEFPAYYNHLWICGFPFSFENGGQAGVTYGAYDSSGSPPGSSQWSVTMPTRSNSSDNYLNLNDYTGIGDEEPSGIFDYAPPKGSVGSMSINLTGTNKVNTWASGGSLNEYGIRNDNKLEFSGNGSVDVNVANVGSSYVQGIYAYGTLTLNDDPTVTVHATSGEDDVYGIWEADPPVINGGSVTASGGTAAWYILNGITAKINCDKSGYVPVATYSADMTGTDSSTIINPTDSTTPTVAALFTKNNGYKYLKLELGTAVPTPTPTPPTYTVEEDTDNGDISYDAAPTYGEDWTCYIDPGNGYTYPDSVTVTIDDKDTSNYTYDKTTGKITVPGQYITGTVKIAGICAKIAKPAAAAKVILLKTINSGRSMKLTWTKVSGATKYVVYGALCNTGNHKYAYKKLKTLSSSKTAYTKTKRANHRGYKYYVAAYKGSKKLCRSISTHTVVKSKSGLYNAVKITAANKTVSLAVGKASKIKATVKAKSGHRLFGSGHCAKVRYVSKNPLIAKVSSKGKITAVATGKTTVYAIAHDGIRVAIRVSVK